VRSGELAHAGHAHYWFVIYPDFWFVISCLGCVLWGFGASDGQLTSCYLNPDSVQIGSCDAAPVVSPW